MMASAMAQSSFNRYNFTVGGGPSRGEGEVAAFSGNTFNGVAGGGLNFSRMFGMDAEYMYYDLSIKPSVANAGTGLNNASGNLQSFSLNGIVNAPLHSRFGAYGIFGLGFYRRSVSATSNLLQAPQACQSIWDRWYGISCFNGGLMGSQTISSFSKDAGGFNFGGGISYRLNHLHNSKIFIEGRYHRAYQSDGQTIVIPVTMGLRW
jgi:Outer membrane protein beta-barrel domain